MTTYVFPMEFLPVVHAFELSNHNETRIPEHPQKLMTRVTQVVCEELGINYEKIHKKHRYKEIVEARQISMLLIKERNANISLKEIGRFFGDRDHTTVIHNCNRLKDLMSTEPELKERVQQIRNLI